MAEEISDGRITIEDTMSPMEIVSANLVQVPEMSETHRVIVYISKHGIPDETWFKFTDNSIISIKPPYFIMCNRKIVLPAMEVTS